ncbi:MAG: hypothetical protein WCK35_22725 [Chloroflexota bacterium]
MKSEVGLWIDHKKSVIVFDDAEEVLTLQSNMEKHVRFSGGTRGKTAYGSNYIPADDQQDRRFAEHLNKYYLEVMSHLRGATAIFIFGPGEAKIEFQKVLEREGLTHAIIRFETTGKLTDRQIAARVKDFFENQKLPVR